MTIYAPYFYIIQDTRNGKYYAGSKYAIKDSDPSKLLSEGGYTTSSNIINEIIEQHGLNVFVIRKIKTFTTAEDARNYETRFLQKVCARTNPNFYNKHNNDGYYDADSAKERMLEIYGVDNFAKSELFPERMRKTCIERYGVEHHLQNPEIMEKHKKTCMERYGVDNVAKSEQSKANHKKTMLENYGVKSYAQTDEFKENHKKHCQEKYGVDHHMMTDECRAHNKELQHQRYERDITKEIKELIIEAKELEIDYSQFGLRKLWWQKTEDNLIPARDSLYLAIQQKKASGFVKKTRREKMQAINQELLNRPIVKKINAAGIRLGSGWWRKNDKELERILATH
jgi:hypothetical protein